MRCDLDIDRICQHLKDFINQEGVSFEAFFEILEMVWTYSTVIF